jgi:hypothetical protein
MLVTLGCAQPFTYQGLLKDGGSPANGNYSMTFRLYDAASGGTLLGTVGPLDVAVSNGLFSVELNFPASVWDGGPRYLEIQVGSTPLSPRVKINPTPYASALRLFESGVGNPDRMVITHSPTFTNWGLQYQDLTDKFNFLAGGTPVMTVDLGYQRVGIGTTSPARPLTIRGEGANAEWLQFRNTSDVNRWHLNHLGNGLNFAESGVADARLFLAAGGNVGIGTSSPAAKLHVEGNGYFNGNLGIGASSPAAKLQVATGTGDRAIYGMHAATSGVAYGVYGQSASTAGTGVFGSTTATNGVAFGVWGQSNSTSGRGMVGYAAATSGDAIGVWGSTNSSFSIAYGVRGEEPLGGEGHAIIAFGTLAAVGTKSFQTDHPLHPETHYLNHFCAEGPEPYNVYRGNVVTDANGYATITLPDYFDSINRDPTYHLTVIDDSDDFVLAKVVRKVQNNQFVIRTSKPHIEVSWEVKAVRNDPWVQRYGYQTEQEKEDEIKGKYLNPELYGQPKERGILYRPEPEPLPNERGNP